MGTTIDKIKGIFKKAPQQGAVYSNSQEQPVLQQQPVQYRPSVAQQQQQPVQYRPLVAQQQQQVPYGYGPSFPNGSSMPRYPGPPPLPLPNNQNQSSYANDMYLANLTGWSPADIERLRYEFSSYANSYGVIEREGFRKLYIASLLNTTWEALERDAEGAFRNFDVNQTGVLDFNEYIIAFSRMSRAVQQPSPPPMNPSYPY